MNKERVQGGQCMTWDRLEDYYELISTKTKEEVKKEYELLANQVGMNKKSAILRICQTYDLIFDQNIIKGCRDISDYMRKIHSLKQYDEKKFKDSIIYLDDNKKDGHPKHCHKFVLEEGLGSVVSTYAIDMEDSNSSSDLKLDLLSALKNDQKLLLKKMSKAIDEDNIGTYKNLVTALREVTFLIQNEEWCQQWSRYSSEDKEYVAVWEQKGSEIKNHRKFEIKNEERITKCEKAYVEVDRDSVCIYFKGEKILIKVNNADVMTNKVKEILNYNKEVPIYMDIRGFGIVVYDALRIDDYNVIDASNSIIKIN